MKQPKVVQRACQLLRRRVLYQGAHLTLPGSERRPMEESDTLPIQQATNLYTRSWILPMLEYLEKGNLRMLAELTEHERGLSIEEGYDYADTLRKPIL